MSNPTNETQPYVAVTDFLQQGDIFRQEVVCPIVDTVKRIFRSVDGRHGSTVFAENVPGKVFDDAELKSTLAATTRTPLHTAPFHTTNDGHPELVVVHASLTSYFILASQTCDISGVDKAASPTAIILPIRTVLEICRYERLPFASMSNELLSIEEFIERNASINTLRSIQDAFSYPAALRKLLQEWNPSGKAVASDKSRIKNYLGKQLKGGWIYYLKDDSAFQVPECCVDFSVAYTVPTARLEGLKGHRIARLGDPYRDHFAQAFASRLSRIAVPKPMAAQDF